MIGKLKALWSLMQAGKRVADPALWKSRQITVTALSAAIWAAAHMANQLGVSLPLDDETVDGIAVGVISVTNFVLTLVTTNKIGLDGVAEPTK
jgi:hypothetical protein